MNLSTKNRIDQYPLTHMDCVEKAICAMLGEFNENFPSTYLIYSNYIWCYKREEIGKFRNEMGILEYLCKNSILPLTFMTKEVISEVYNSVENFIEQGKVCLIPGNLNELYYSKYYHTCNWPHLFYINGCRKGEKIFNIIDSVQKTENEQIFSKFVMEYEKLEKVYTSYCLTYKDNMMYSKPNVIYYFEKSPASEKEVDIFQIIKSIIVELEETYNGHNEIQMINNIKKMYIMGSERQFNYNYDIKEFLGNVKIKFGRIIKKKEVFFSEILSNIDNYIKPDILEELKKESSTLIKNWNAFFRIMIADFLRGNITEVENKLRNSINQECDYINKLYDTVVHCEVRNVDVALKKIWKYENNKEKEIYFDKNIFTLKIRNDHNAWIEDNSIKIMLRQTVANKKKLRLISHVSVLGSYKNTNYHVGIVFKTSNDKMYFWGCYNEECIRLSNIGIKVDVIDMVSNDKITEVDLGVIKEDSIVRLYYRTKSGKDKYVKIPVLGEQIVEIGLGCKTWENEYDNEFKVEFSNIVYDISE